MCAGEGTGLEDAVLGVDVHCNVSSSERVFLRIDVGVFHCTTLPHQGVGLAVCKCT